MKRKIIFLTTLVALTGLVVLLGCKKEKGPGITEHFSFTTPTVTSPENNSTVHLGVGVSTVQLQWNSTDQSGDPVKVDVYFGEGAQPPLFAANQTSLSLTVNVTIGATYNWYVVMKDANGVRTASPTWTFTIFDPIAIFTGLFDTDEPAESYHYDVTFVKTNDSTITTDNYWNSGWTGPFTIRFSNNTYNMPLQQWTANWKGQESGTVDPATGTMIGNYTIWYKGAVAETGVHTYTRK